MDRKVKDSLGLLLLAPLVIAIGLGLSASGNSDIGMPTWIGGVVVALYALTSIGMHLVKDAAQPSDAPRPQ